MILLEFYSSRLECRTDRLKSQIYELTFEDGQGTSKIQFKICPDMIEDHANIINSVGTRNHLSKVVLEGDQKPGTMSLINKNNPQLGVIINYEGGNMCNEESKAYYSLKV